MAPTLQVGARPDADDGEPVWAVRPGGSLVPGVQAWQRLAVGLRCETWLGWSAPLWSPVVVKLARPEQCGSERGRRALGREVRALAGLQHPVLARLYQHDLAAEIPYLCTEYVDGRPLDDLVPEHRHGLRRLSRMHPDAVLTLAAQLLSALVPVHARGLAHLDIKPENVIIRDGRPVLIDFGSARPIGSGHPAGRPVGTAGWVSPELEACAPVDPAMDVYGVGAVLRACSPPRVGRHRRLSDLVDDLTAPDAGDRPDVSTALARVADALPARRRPWPAWAGRSESAG